MSRSATCAICAQSASLAWPCPVEPPCSGTAFVSLRMLTLVPPTARRAVLLMRAPRGPPTLDWAWGAGTGGREGMGATAVGAAMGLVMRDNMGGGLLWGGGLGWGEGTAGGPRRRGRRARTARRIGDAGYARRA